jgi:predicted dehydrogenase
MRKMTNQPELRIGMVGYMFMGRAHTQAWSAVARAFDLPARPVLQAICGRDPKEAGRAASRLGWPEVEHDWRVLVERDDVDVIDICVPAYLHEPIAVAALAAGKHVLCEKPLANTVAEATQMVRAAREASKRGVRSMLGFNYRRVPALAYAWQLVRDGRLGEIRHVRVAYLQDWLSDSSAPMNWRMTSQASGSGVLADLGSHAIDLSQHLLDEQIEAVAGLTTTFVKQRPLPADVDHPQHGLGPDMRTGVVDVPDAAAFMARFPSGAVGTYEVSRMATGRKNSLRVELNGSRGSVAFDLERLNELEFFDATQPPDEQGFKRVLMTEEVHPWVAAWWPPGHVIGWEHTFSHEMRDFIVAIVDGHDPWPSFDDGRQVQVVLDAVERSSGSGGWVEATVAESVA